MMRPTRFALALLASIVPVAASSLGGCADDSGTSTTPDAAAPDDAAAAPDTTDATRVASLVVDVVADEAKATPISGATGFLDYADGTSETQTSDAKGRLSFFSSSASKGLVAVSVGIAGRSVMSIVAPEAKSLTANPISLPLVALPPTHHLHGQLKTVNVGDGVLMQTTVLGGGFQIDQSTATSTYSLDVQTGQLFTVYGNEHAMPTPMTRGFSQPSVKWFHFDHPALTAETTLDLDLATLAADATTTVTGKLVIPGGDAGPLGGASTAFAIVIGDKGQGSPIEPNIGEVTSIAPAADLAAFDFAMDYVAQPNVRPFTYGEIDTQDGSRSVRIVPGFPTNAQVIDGFEVPLAIADQLKMGSTIDATKTLSADVVTLIVAPSSSIDPSSTFSAVWQVVVPSGTSSKVPRLPDALRTIVGTDQRATLQVIRGTDPVVPALLTYSRVVGLVP